jgi:small redox-active disulfide protein 2
MKQITVYGSGCSNCNKTVDLIDSVAKALDAEVTITKESRLEAIMAAGVLRTPAVAIDGELVHSGSIPAREAVQSWLA